MSSENRTPDPLRDQLVYHHLDGDPTNNSPENVVLVDPRDHAGYRAKMPRGLTAAEQAELAALRIWKANYVARHSRPSDN